MGELGALFNPGMRHELEERRAKAARREEEGNAKDGDLRIDLESGVAVINAPGQGDSARPVTARDDERPANTTSSAERADRSDTAADVDTNSDARSSAAGSADTSQSPSPASPATSGDPKQTGPTAQQLRPRGKRGVAAGR